MDPTRLELVTSAARAERRFRGRSPWFVKSLRIGEFAKYLTRDVRHCSCRLSSNCRQLKSASWFRCAKHYVLGGTVPCPAGGRRHRTIGVDDSVESADGTFGEWCGYAVTYPTKHKRSRATFPRSALQGTHANIRSSEVLGIGHRLRHRLICNAEADALNYSVCMR